MSDQYIYKIPYDEVKAKLLTDSENASLYFVFFSPHDRQYELAFQGLTYRYRMLYQGEAQKDFGDRSPWVVELNEEDTTLDYAVDQCFGKRLGIFVISHADIDAITSHFRRFVKVKERDGDLIFFHFFDPDNCANILPFFTGEQRSYFFSKFNKIYYEILDYRFLSIGCMACTDNGALNVDTQAFLNEDTLDIGTIKNTIDPPEDKLPHIFNYDYEGTTIRPFVTLTSDQIAAPIVFNRRKLVSSILTDLEDDYGEALSILPPAMRYANMSVGIDHAMSYKIYHYEYILAFVRIMLSVAPGWHKEKTLNLVLSDHILSTEQKFLKIVNERYDDAWASAEKINSADEWLSDDWEKL